MKLQDSISFKQNIGYVWLVGTCIVCVVVSYLFYDLMLLPQMNSKEALSNQLQMESVRVATIEQFGIDHPDTQQYLRDLDLEKVRLDKLLPEKVNLGETVAFLEDTSKATGVVFGAFKTEQSVFRNGCTETQFSFNVFGNYKDLIEFTRKLDAGPRFMAVRAVEFHDRVLLNRISLDSKTIQDVLEKQLTNQTGALARQVIDRGLLQKQNLIVMTVSLVMATQGQLPGTTVPQGQPPVPKS